MDVTITNAGGRIEIVDLRNDLTNNYNVLKDGLRLFNLGDIVRITFINRRNIEINFNEVELINGATSVFPVSGVDFLNELNVLLGDFGTGGGATALEDLTDVEITSVANGEVLIYDSALSKWVNTSAPGGGDMFKSVYDTDNDGNVDKAETVQITVRNSTGVTLTKGQIVYLSGATGNRPNAVLAQANNVNSKKTIGWVTANISNNSDGFVAVSGSAHDLDTSAFSAGDLLYLSSTVAGGITSTIPAHPNYEIFIGFCARAHPNFGRIIFKIAEVLEIESLHDVSITSPQNNEALIYESLSQLWKNKPIAQALGITPAFKSGLDSPSYSANTNTAVYTQLIAANTFIAGDVLRVLFRTRKTGALGSQTLRIYVNATADLLGTPILIAFYAPAGLTGVYNQMQRHIAIKSATILTEVIRTNANLPQDLGNDTFPVSSLVINWTLNRYFVFAIQNSSALDVNFGSLFAIERL
jgi:hypothetical protein